MKCDTMIQTKMESLLSEVGLTLPQLLQVLGKNKSTLLNMDEKNLKNFIEIYDKIDKKECENTEKGKLLEKLSGILFQESSQKLFCVRNNCRTSTNEVDSLIEWTEYARISGLCNAYPCFSDSFICECKNYKGQVDVTYVGKFCSLLVVSNIKLGIMISWEGITGRNKWEAAKGLVKKIALSEKIYIIVLDKKDLREIYENKNNIFSLVHEKYLALKADIDYAKYIQKHGAEDQLIS